MNSINISLAVAKQENDHYMDGLSPPSSANEPDTLPPLASLHGQVPHQNFQTRFPPAAHYGGVMYDREDDDEEEMDSNQDMDNDMIQHHTETVRVPIRVITGYGG